MNPPAANRTLITLTSRLVAHKRKVEGAGLRLVSGYRSWLPRIREKGWGIPSVVRVRGIGDKPVAAAT